MKFLRYPKKTKTGSLKPFGECIYARYSDFPPENWAPLAQLFRVLDLAHEANLSGVPTTKRYLGFVFSESKTTI